MHRLSLALAVSLVPSVLGAAVCTVDLPEPGPRASAPLCVSSSSPDGLVGAFAQETIELDCPTPLQAGDVLRIQTATTGIWGFPTTGSGSPFVPVSGAVLTSSATWGSPRTPVADTFGSGGQLLTSSVEFEYQGADASASSLSVGLTLSVPASAPTADVDLLVAADGGATSSWPFAELVPCAANPVSLFFPHLPAVTGDPVGLVGTKLRATWVEFTVSQHGEIDADEVRLSLYEQDGSRWSASLGPLAVREQQTLRFVATPSGVELQDAADGTSLPVVYEGGDPTLLDSPATMFLRATAEVDFLEEVFDLDLDGALTLMQGSRIGGVYLPRNYDNDVPHQNTDLPLQKD